MQYGSAELTSPCITQLGAEVREVAEDFLPIDCVRMALTNGIWKLLNSGQELDYFVLCIWELNRH